MLMVASASLTVVLHTASVAQTEPVALTKPVTQSPTRRLQAEHEQDEDKTFTWQMLAPWYTYWRGARSRPFFSGEVALGAYSRMDLVLGYGKPFWRYVGLNYHMGSTPQFVDFYVGPRLELLGINAVVSFRETWAYRRKQPTHAALGTDPFTVKSDVPNRYQSVDAWLWGYLPAGPVLGFWEVAAVHAFNQPDSHALFEEFFFTYLGRKTGIMGKLHVYLQLLRNSIQLGPALDAVFSPGRDPLLRLGAGAAWRLTRHLSAAAIITFPVVQPDEVPWTYQYWGTARINYAFATGETRPGF